MTSGPFTNGELPGMTGLDLNLEPDDGEYADIVQGVVSQIAYLPEATAKGLAGVAVIVRLPDGTRVSGVTTLALFQMANAGLAGRDSR